MQHLERNQTLVVIHAYHGVEFFIQQALKYRICRQRPVNRVSLRKFIYCRLDYPVLFLAYFLAVRIQGANSYFGILNAEILSKRIISKQDIIQDISYID